MLIVVLLQLFFNFKLVHFYSITIIPLLQILEEVWIPDCLFITERYLKAFNVPVIIDVPIEYKVARFSLTNIYCLDSIQYFGTEENRGVRFE